MSAAGVFIVVGFFMFAFCALLLLAPGLLLYKAGLQNLYNDITVNSSSNLIDVTPQKPAAGFGNKIKPIIRKIRNFLNKYAD